MSTHRGATCDKCNSTYPSGPCRSAAPHFVYIVCEGSSLAHITKFTPPQQEASGSFFFRSVLTWMCCNHTTCGVCRWLHPDWWQVHPTFLVLAAERQPQRRRPQSPIRLAKGWKEKPRWYVKASNSRAAFNAVVPARKISPLKVMRILGVQVGEAVGKAKYS